MKLDGLIQSPIYNRDSVSVNSVFLLSSYINIPFMMIFLLLLFWGRNIFPMPFSWSSLVAHLVKNLPAMWETWVRCLGWEDFPGEGNSYPLQYSGLENSMDYIVHGVANSQTWRSEIHFHFSTFSGWCNNQIDIRQINKRRIYLITYLPGLHKGSDTQEQVRQLRLECCFDLKNGIGFWALKGEEGASQDNKKSRHIVITCLSCYNVGH